MMNYINHNDNETMVKSHTCFQSEGRVEQNLIEHA